MEKQNKLFCIIHEIRNKYLNDVVRRGNERMKNSKIHTLAISWRERDGKIRKFTSHIAGGKF